MFRLFERKQMALRLTFGERSPIIWIRPGLQMPALSDPLENCLLVLVIFLSRRPLPSPGLVFIHSDVSYLSSIQETLLDRFLFSLVYHPIEEPVPMAVLV